MTTGNIMQAVIDNRISLLHQAQLPYHASPMHSVVEDVKIVIMYDFRDKKISSTLRARRGHLDCVGRQG